MEAAPQGSQEIASVGTRRIGFKGVGAAQPAMKQKLIEGQAVKAVLNDGKVVAGQFVKEITKIDQRLFGDIHRLLLIEIHGPTRYKGTWAVTKDQLLVK